MALDVLGKALALLGSPGTLPACRCREPLGVVTGHDKRDTELMSALEVILGR
ncbi:MAG: hypothetical protein MZU79_01915 [Anaerotruncus sp.]|nr:hypothetical protein [Anaerotruncus sp.]